MVKNYLIGDLHLGHTKISSKFRTEFDSDEHHNEFIFNNIMECSGKKNDLWLLGDVVFEKNLFWMLGQMTEKFRNVSIVLGNHDHHNNITKYCSDNNIAMYGFIKKWCFWLSHCPIHPQEMYRAKGNIHGHLHTNTIKDDRYFGVSCEQLDYKPITLQEIVTKFDNQQKD